MLDRAVSLRLPMDLLHRLEIRVAAINTARAEGGKTAISISEIVRHMVKVGLDVTDRDNPEEAEEWLGDLFGPTLANMIARAATDDDAARLLKKIAARHEPKPVVESDFG